MNRDYDRAKDMYEVAMENVLKRLDVAKAYLEQLSSELYDVDLSEDEWRKLDKILNKAMVSLEGF
ncbi:hypothetical protein ABE073_05085 [Lederbergia citrisecunda]|uniref:hypothetical protein n=1 Tax=Lederbergia citrisecunda TaxID=2833583 RepID=UPI003D26BF06